MLRSEYLRLAWQAYDKNDVRFSLDEHMLLLREARPATAAGTGSSPAWCSPLETVEELPAADAVRFPYGILEIKLQDKDGAPAWVQELIASSMLVEAPRFSKFIHGMALLEYGKVEQVPAWFVEREGGGLLLPASIEELWEMTAERRLEQAEAAQVRALSEILGAQSPGQCSHVLSSRVSAACGFCSGIQVVCGSVAALRNCTPSLHPNALQPLALEQDLGCMSALTVPVAVAAAVVGAAGARCAQHTHRRCGLYAAAPGGAPPAQPHQRLPQHRPKQRLGPQRPPQAAAAVQQRQLRHLGTVCHQPVDERPCQPAERQPSERDPTQRQPAAQPWDQPVCRSTCRQLC